jgi:hypothetical protein
MMTSSYVNGSYKTAYYHASEVANALAIRQYKILRVKIESMLGNEGVPEEGL